MTSDSIIRVEAISKCYSIGHDTRENYSTLRETVMHSVKSFFKRPKTPERSTEDFWALRDVSFDVKPGERVGIIGRNGAGKTTLLKILSRITAPTQGRITMRGRVASLLEVGTGFHPELTGRENIFLNGSILGMSREEIRKKFDEIVDFAEVEQFLDTPVKRYSSGMYVRLAFAVAGHLEPEILLVDEVLAVGDMQFQKKCLGKMQQVSQEGRTILFVSHNMGYITRLCTRGIYLEAGRIQEMGEVNQVVSRYLQAGEAEGDGTRNLAVPQPALAEAKGLYFTKVGILDSNHKGTSQIDLRHPFKITLDYQVTRPLRNVEISVRVEENDGTPIFIAHQSDSHTGVLESREPGLHTASVEVPAMFLMPGRYLITVMAHEPMVQFYDLHEHALVFTIFETGSKRAKYSQDRSHGVVMVDFPWTAEAA